MAKRYFYPLPYDVFVSEMKVKPEADKAGELGMAEYESNRTQDGPIKWFSYREFYDQFEEFIVEEPDGSPHSRIVVDKP